MQDTQLLVMATAHEAQIRVIGRATLGRSRCLREFALDMLERGVTRFVVDLAECVAMDSTFAGTLALIAVRTRTQSGTVEIVNANARTDGVLKSLGLKKLFLCRQGVTMSPHGAILPEPADDGGASAAPLRRTILEAHETLAEVDIANVAKFRDVIACLRAEHAESRRDEETR